MTLIKPEWKRIRDKWYKAGVKNKRKIEVKVGKITNQKLLGDLVMDTDFQYSVFTPGVIAIRNITDKNVLLSIISNCKYEYTCIAAVMRIAEQNVLIDITMNDKYHFTPHQAAV